MLVDRFGNAFQQFETGEQDTGLKWQDGRPIYRNYKRIDLSNTNLQGSVDIGANDYDFVWIDPYSCLWSTQSYSVGADHYFYPVNYGKEINALIHNNNLEVSLASNFSGWYNVFYIYYLYVKKN
jgi:hypothetical protein